MPQMSPMHWINLPLSFTLIILSMILLLYFSSFPSPSTHHPTLPTPTTWMW